MPRFVVLFHEMPADSERGSHWDWMFEHQGSLGTWAVDELPSGGKPVAAMRLADHRLAYLTYEGLLQGGRGSVRREDEGEYRVLEVTDQRWRLELAGARWQGHVCLELDDADRQRWLLSFAPSVNAT